MSFREKTAWVMTLILSLGAFFYLEDVVSLSRALGRTAPAEIGPVIGFVVFIVVASVIVMSILGGASRGEANAPADERERLIADKAGSWSGVVLAVPAVGALVHYSVNGDGDALFHVVFLSFVLSQIADYAFQIWLFRRGV